MWRRLLYPSSLILIGANLVPLIGVAAWGWDAFVLLMLYWLETAVIAFWVVMRVATMPAGALDELQFRDASGKRIGSPIGMALFFTLHAGIFMFVHFLFLWDLFSGEWSRKIRGVGAFIDQMIVGTGLWVPLLALFIVRGALMLFDSLEPRLRHMFGLVAKAPERSALGPGETIVFGLYVRIFVMQVTILLGAWIALTAGTSGALVFLIAVKTAIDLSFQLIAARFHAAWLKSKAEQESKAQT
jgi:hypothetical protein